MYNGFKQRFGEVSPWNPTGNTLPNGIANTMPLGNPQQPDGMSALQQALLSFRQMATQPVNPAQTPMASQTTFPDLETAFQRFSQLINQARGSSGAQLKTLGNTQIGQSFFNNLINQPTNQSAPNQFMGMTGTVPMGNTPKSFEKPSPSRGTSDGDIRAKANTVMSTSKGGDASSIFSGSTVRY